MFRGSHFPHRNCPTVLEESGENNLDVDAYNNSSEDSLPVNGPGKPSQQRRSALNTIPDPSNLGRPSTSNAPIRRPISNSSHSKSSLDAENVLGALERSSDNLESNSQIRETKRFKVFCELLDTEQNYVDILKLMVDKFKIPMSKFITRRELNTIFAKIEPLLHVHETILASLRALAGPNFREWKENKLVGQVYATPRKDMAERYVSYMNSYDQAMTSLDDLLANEKFSAQLKDLESDPECKKCSLKDMLIRPVQRLPSVILLLKELRKATDKANPDYPWLDEALRSVDDVLKQSNSRRRQTDVYSSFIQICNDIEGFPPSYVASSREIHGSVDLLVLGAGGIFSKYKNRVVSFFLFNDVVLAAKKRQCSGMSKQSGFSHSTQTLNSSSSSNMTMSMSMTGNRTLMRNHSFISPFRAPPRKPYRYIDNFRFSSFRQIFHTQGNGVFFMKIRDLKADEMCAFQITPDSDDRTAFRFFSDLLRLINANSTRNLVLEDAIDLMEKRTYCSLDQEDKDFMKKMLAMAGNDNGSALRRSHSQLRRAVSSVSMHIQRMTSRNRLNESVAFLPR